MAEGTGDQTEVATPKRRQRAREQGQVALSREVAPAAVLGASTVMLMMALPPLSRGVALQLADFLGSADRLDPIEALHAAVRLIVMVSLPFAAVAAVVSAVSVLAQTGLLLRLEALLPDLARLSPLAGLRRVFGGATLGETGRSLLKLAAVSVAAWWALHNVAAHAITALAWPPITLLDQALRAALRLMLMVFGLQLALAVADIARTRMALAGKLRMSRHDVREEHRESEGDPQIKARIRRLRSQRARKRMMAAVPKATVVITNPTHYAVALAYERGSTGAPRVVAKGVDVLAARIREVASKARVPLIVNPPLARALWRVEVDDEIPADMFQVVAEVIAAVWRLRTPRR